MNIFLESILPFLMPSFIGFIISLLLSEYYGKDYSILLTIAIILFITGTPLIIILFFNSEFNSSFYLWEMSWAPAFLVGNIVDLIFYPLFHKILLYFSDN